jgi:hypothetical protein
MGVIKGLKGIQNYYAEQERRREEAQAPKSVWFSLKDGESAKVRFLQELDPDSNQYSERNGLGFIAVEHSSPADFKRKALCTADEGDCYACEQNRLSYQNDTEEKGKWKAKSRLYINVLVDKAGEEPYVAILSQGNSPKAVTPTLIEYAAESGAITNRWWKITRKGAGFNDTSYTVMAFDPKDDVNVEEYELFDLDSVVRAVPYDEQEAHYGVKHETAPERTFAAAHAEPVGADEW